MALNKRAETKIATVLIWILIIGAIAYVADFGGFRGTVDSYLKKPTTPSTSPGTAVEPTLSDTKDCPTDGTTTYTMNIIDALTTTATSRYPEYYIFNANQLIKEGTLSSTASTVSLACGRDYDVLLINTTSGDNNGGLYPEVVQLKARIAQQTLNAQMYSIGDAKIYKLINPIETAGSTAYFNLSLPANSEKNWEIQFGANTSQKAFNKPIILCNVNSTEISAISLDSFSDGKKPVVKSVPKRITASTGRAYYAWEYPGMIDMTQGIKTGAGTIKSTSSMPVTLTNAQNMTCILADQTKWKTSTYKTAGSIDEAFKEGAENEESLADIGADDTTADVAGTAPDSFMSFWNDNED